MDPKPHEDSRTQKLVASAAPPRAASSRASPHDSLSAPRLRHRPLPERPPPPLRPPAVARSTNSCTCSVAAAVEIESPLRTGEATRPRPQPPDSDAARHGYSPSTKHGTWRGSPPPPSSTGHTRPARWCLISPRLLCSSSNGVRQVTIIMEKVSVATARKKPTSDGAAQLPGPCSLTSTYAAPLQLLATARTTCSMKCPRDLALFSRHYFVYVYM